MSKHVIEVKNLSKAYRIGLKENIPDTLMGAATSLVKSPWHNFQRLRRLNTFNEVVRNQDSEVNGNGSPHSAETSSTDSDIIWALKDVSFQVAEGEVVGIIGRNGAGKSTLLKILSRITEPTSGKAVIRGRVSSLLEVGTGFHPELTGRENIYMNGTILGMKKREIDRKFDEIVDFSGVKKFLDTPIKRFSSGMKVRLAFSVAAHLDPEVLIIDEVLAVGDAEFQKRCLGKMQDVAKGGRTVLFVSHNMPAVRTLTSRSAYLRNGCLIKIAETSRTIDTYLDESVKAHSGRSDFSLDYYRQRIKQDSPAKFKKIWVEPTSAINGSLPTFNCGEDIILCFEIDATERVHAACVSVSVLKNQEERVATLFSGDQNYHLDLNPGRQAFRCILRDLPFSPGRYTITIGVNQNANAIAFDVVQDMPVFEIEFQDAISGNLDWTHRPWGTVHWTKVEWKQV